MKYRIHKKKTYVIIKGRLTYQERINERELNYLTQNEIKGLFQISYDGKKLLTYQAPCTISLEKYLKGNRLEEAAFWRVVTQMVDTVITVKNKGLYSTHLLIQLDTIFIKEDTQELFLLYQPVISPKNMTDNLFAVIYDIIFQEMQKGEETKQAYLIDFQNYLQRSNYNLMHVRRYIDQAVSGHSACSGQTRHRTDQDDYEPEDRDEYTVLLGSIGNMPVSSVNGEKSIYLTRIKKNEQVVLSGNECHLGRGSQNDYCILGNSSIGRKHAVIKKCRDVCFLMDLGSVNGTFLNGKRLSERKEYRLQNQDKIGLSNEEFVFEFK